MNQLIKGFASTIVVATCCTAFNAFAGRSTEIDYSYTPPSIDSADAMGARQIIAVDIHHNNGRKANPDGGFYKLLTADNYIVQRFNVAFPTNASTDPNDDNYVDKRDPNNINYDPKYLVSCDDVTSLYHCDYYQRLLEIDTLVLQNPGGGLNDISNTNFVNRAEAKVLKHWVEQGGNLFFIADHAPFPSRIQEFADEFDLIWPVTRYIVGNDFENSKHYFPWTSYSISGAEPAGYEKDSTIQLFNSPVINGGTIFESPDVGTIINLDGRLHLTYEGIFGRVLGLENELPVYRVETYGGSLFKAKAGGYSANAIPLLVPHQDYNADQDSPYGYHSGLLVDTGACGVKGKRGRIYFGSEAAMFSASVSKYTFWIFSYYHDFMGINVPTNDNGNLLRNIMAWLHQPC